MPVGYSQQPYKGVIITNTGNQTVTLNGLPTVTNYTLFSGNFLQSGGSLPAGQNVYFEIRPNTGLAPGVYNETLTITGSNGVSAQVPVSFTVTAGTAPTIPTSGQPKNQIVKSGSIATFTCSANGSPTPTYQWQIFNGTTWENLSDGKQNLLGTVSGATTGTLTIVPTPSANGSQFRCIASNGVSPNATSNVATLTVN